MSHVTPLGPLKTKKKGSAAPPPHLIARRASPSKQCADKHLGTKFRQRGISLYLAVTPRPLVSVRFLHDFSKVCSRSISGSLLQWKVSGGSKTFPEQSQTRVQRTWSCRDLCHDPTPIAQFRCSRFGDIAASIVADHASSGRIRKRHRQARKRG